MTLRHSLAVLPGIAVSLLPRLMCPACWPAYAGIVWCTVGRYSGSGENALHSSPQRQIQTLAARGGTRVGPGVDAR
jgi:hypothetical protein